MAEPRSIRIMTAEGPLGLVVTDSETGHPIPRVRSVTFQWVVGGAATATIEAFVPQVDVVCEARVSNICPFCERHLFWGGAEEKGADRG